MGDFAYSVPSTGSTSGVGVGEHLFGNHSSGTPDMSDTGTAPSGPSPSPGNTAAGPPPSSAFASHAPYPPSSSAGPSHTWSFSAPSPPGTAQSTVSSAFNTSSHFPGHQNGSQHVNNQSNFQHGYNTSNTRPMTAPSSANPPAYAGGAYAGMFSPATYSGAGFPQSFIHRPPGANVNMLQGGVALGPTSGVSYRNRMNGQQLEVLGIGGPPEHSLRGPESSPSINSDPFLHSLSSIPYGAGPPSHTGYAAHSYQGRPGVDVGARRAYEDINAELRLGSSHGRPGTADTARPDTANSAYSTYSTASASAFGIPHPSLYNTVGGHPDYASSIPNSHKYNFVPLPSQPKKRPRRRFEEVERLYDCNYPGCTKAYGTLNHLNAHVSMQKHGPKRLPAEFKEIRKAWRQRKKEADAAHSGENSPEKGGSPKGKGIHPPGTFNGQATAIGANGERIRIAHPGALNGAPAAMSNPSNIAIPGFPNYYASPNGYGRPNTAPGHMVHQAFGQSAMSSSPMLSGLPPGYLASRKNSITSVPPAFASIQEDPAGETRAQQSAYDAPLGPDPSAVSLHPPMTGGSVHNGSRPSTASSPFRYSVPPEGDVASQATTITPSGPPLNPFESEHQHTPGELYGNVSPADLSGRWSPDWKSLNAPNRYKQEIR